MIPTCSSFANDKFNKECIMDQGIVSEVKACIRSIIIATSHSMKILDLEKDYKSFMGTALPYKSLGFKSSEQLLRSMPDVVKIVGYGPQAFVQYIPNKKSNHIANMVKHQKTENRRRRRTPRYRNRNSYTFDFSLSDDNDEEADALKKKNINESKADPQRKQNLFSLSDDNDEEADALKKKNINESKADPQRKQNPATSFSSSNESEGSARKQQPVCMTNVSTNNDNGNGRLPTTAAAQKHEPIDYREQISRREEAINKRFDLLFNSSKDSDIYDAETKPLSTNTRNTILFGPRIYPIANRKKQNGKIPEDAMTEGIKNIVISSTKMKQKNRMIQIPQCDLYEELKEGSIISLYISEINNALEFYFHIDKENHELLQLDKDMREKYSRLAKKELVLPDSYLEPGRYCAVDQGSSWYRAKILYVPPDINVFSKIKLLLIDFGRVKSVSVQYLKFLAPIFDLPVQAARARLSHIKSNERAKNNEATKCFASLARGRCLYAYIKNVDKETPSFELILLDTSKQPKCNINETIIKNGFADRE